MHLHEAAIILLSIVALVALAALICWMIAWIGFGLSLLFRPFARQPPDTPEEYRARRCEPQWDVLAAHYGAPAPATLQRLYRSADLIEQTEFFLADAHDPDPAGGQFIRQFLPADHKALEFRPRRLPSPFFPFAEDDAGRLYCVRIEGDAREPVPVYLWSPRGLPRAEVTSIAGSLDEFLARPRHSGRGAGGER